MHSGKMFWRRFRDKFVCVRIVLLDRPDLDYQCRLSCTGKDVLDFVLEQLDLVEREYFGLRYLDSADQVHWLDMSKSLKKQLKKCTMPYKFYFCVKFYASDPAQLQEEVTRYHFFMQLRQDIRYGRLPVPQDALVELGGCVLQAEMGDFDPNQHEPGYSADLEFAPEHDPRLDKKMEAVHKTLRGLSASEAEYRFLTHARTLDLYGVHLHSVLGEADISDPYTTDSGYFLGISPAGILMVQNTVKVCEFPWPKILSLHKDIPHSRGDRGGSIILRVLDNNDKAKTFGFRLGSREACKLLWKTAVEHQKFAKKHSKSSVYKSPSISSRLWRIGSMFRSSSRADSDCGSCFSERRPNRVEPKVDRPASVRAPRVRTRSTVIYENQEMTVLLGNDGEVIKQLKMPPAEEYDRLGELPRSFGSRSLRRVAPRSSSPMSMQSSFSTTPRRIHEVRTVEMDNDNDSVFSSSSRLSRAISETDSLMKKRKRSAVLENHSSGASEESDKQGSTGLRSSLGPQRRQGKMPVRHRTVDSSVTQQALARLKNSPNRDLQKRELNLPNRLASVLQPARSMSYLGNNRMEPLASPAGSMVSTGFSFTLDFRKPVEIPVKEQTCHVSTAQIKLADLREPSPGLSSSSTYPSGFYRIGSEKSPRMPLSPMRTSKSFDFRAETERLSLPRQESVPLPEPPRHIRSLSSSEFSRQSPVLRSGRSRLCSDSQFMVSHSPMIRSDREDSPLMSPFPIIPPPTPFTEPFIEEPPAVPARPSRSFLQNQPKNKFGSGKNRADSFTAALQRNEMEMRVIPTTANYQSPEELVYDTVYDCLDKSDAGCQKENVRQVVAVDVHVPKTSTLVSERSKCTEENVCDNFRCGMRAPLRNVYEGSSGIPGVVQNEMYFDMDVKDRDPYYGGKMHPSAMRPVPVPAAQLQKLGLPSNCAVLSHPLAVFSTSSDSGMERSVSSTSSATPAKHSPEEPEIFDAGSSSLRLLQNAYANSEYHALSTSI